MSVHINTIQLSSYIHAYTNEMHSLENLQGLILSLLWLVCVAHNYYYQSVVVMFAKECASFVYVHIINNIVWKVGCFAGFCHHHMSAMSLLTAYTCVWISFVWNGTKTHLWTIILCKKVQYIHKYKELQ